MSDDDLDDEGGHTSNVAALEDALRTAPYLPRDVAMVHLATRYAQMLDDALDRLDDSSEREEDEGRDFARVVAVIAKIGPRYEAVLDKLGMSPGARPAVRGGEPHGVDPSTSALEQLRGDSAAGVDPAAYLDPAVAEALASD